MVNPFKLVMYLLIFWFKILSNVVTMPLMGFNLLSHIKELNWHKLVLGCDDQFMFHGFIKGVPLEIEEAAAIDDCNKFQTFLVCGFTVIKTDLCDNHYLKCYLDLE